MFGGSRSAWSFFFVLLLSCGFAACSAGSAPVSDGVDSAPPALRAGTPVPVSGFIPLTRAQSFVPATSTPVPTLPVPETGVLPFTSDSGDEFIAGLTVPTPTFDAGELVPLVGVGPSVEQRWIDLPSGYLSASCDEALRAAALAAALEFDIDGVVLGEFIAQVQLARADCVPGVWSPVAALSVGCPGIFGSVHEVVVSEALIERRFSLKRPFLLPSGVDSDGNVLLHFSSGLGGPGDTPGGCWYYDAESHSWAWAVVRPTRFGSHVLDSGVHRLGFPACDYQLREYLVTSLSSDGGSRANVVNVAEVARLLDQVRAFHAEQCSSLLWDLFPRDEGWPSCAGVPTGLAPDGSRLVVNWHLDFPALDGAVCWEYVLENGEWRSGYGEL